MENTQKKFTVLQAHTLRDLVDMANKQGITKEDVISLLPRDDGFALIYYK